MTVKLEFMEQVANARDCSYEMFKFVKVKLASEVVKCQKRLKKRFAVVAENP